jgi:cation diffusion facilitator family transporter
VKKSQVLWLSVGAAVSTILLKFGAYLVTDSVSLLSDAAESLVNLAAAIFALIALQVASQPPDEAHSFGHDKAEYFSSGVEGVLILAAAAAIFFSALDRLLNPQPIEQLGLGLFISLLAAGINLFVARVLFRASHRYDSITLEADARHLMTDVWTSVGIVIGLIVVVTSGWEILDPLIAILVALNITRTGWNLVARSAQGLMDQSLPLEEVADIEQVLKRHQGSFVAYHALRTRKSGPRRFVGLHLLVRGGMSVQESHTLCNNIEADIHNVLNRTVVHIHVEPAEDETAWTDDVLEGEARLVSDLEVSSK